jgi:hypothetical protein
LVTLQPYARVIQIAAVFQLPRTFLKEHRISLSAMRLLFEPLGLDLMLSSLLSVGLLFPKISSSLPL